MRQIRFGHEVRQARIRLRISQGALARLAGVSRQTVNAVEQGHDCLLGVAERIRQALSAEQASQHEARRVWEQAHGSDLT